MFELIYVIRVVVVAVFAGVMSACIFGYINAFFAKHDNNNIVVTHNVLIIYTVMMAGMNVGLQIKYGLTLSYLFLMLLVLYLSICAYIDYKIQMVYTLLSIMAGVFGLIFFAYTAYTYQTWKNISLLDAVVFAVIMAVCKVKNLFGGGDWDVFVVIAIYICALPSEVFPVTKVLLIMTISILLQFIVNIRNYDFKRGRLKEAVALVPSIFVSVAVCLFV